MGRFRSDYAGIEFFHLFLQLLAQALQFRQAGPPAAAHFADQPNQFPAVEGHVKITAEGIRQDKPRVLPGNSRCAEPVVKGEQPVHSGTIRRKLIFRQSRRNKIARPGIVHIAPGFHRVGSQPVFDHKLFRQYADVVKGNGKKLMLQNGFMA